MIANTKNKSAGILFVMILVGLILGGFLGDFFSGYKYIGLISKGKDFGFSSPLNLNLGILALMFNFKLKINLAGIIGMFVAIFIYKKL